MKRTIFCPECAAEIYNYDGYTTSEVVVRCKNCRRFVKYKPLGNVTIVVDKPDVKSASGARFW